MTSTIQNPDPVRGAAFDLTGKSALVTGASRGIGRAIAIGLAAHGAQVLAVARSPEGLADTVKSSAGASGSVEAHVADLRSQDSVERSVETAVDALGGLDILVNNAADDQETSVDETDLASWQRVLELNLQSCFLMAKAASPHLQGGAGGKVINIASMFGLVGVRDDAAYVVSKHGVIGLTRVLALEWARRNVQVNALAPGFVETDMTRRALGDEKVARWMTRNTPMGRWAQPEDMVGPVVFLASGASDFMTGQVLVVDGGYTAQ